MNCKIFILLLSIFSAKSQDNGRSLLIAFDTTGSMYDDLLQLRSAAITITNDLSAQEENHITDYVLVEFNDPGVKEPFVTNDASKLIAELNKIYVTGGGDCPELPLTGLEAGIKAAQPQSFAFIFTDADAKDYYLQERVIELMKSREIYLNLIVSNRCGSEDDPRHQVYYTLATHGHGLVFYVPTRYVSATMNTFMVQLRVDYDGLFDASGAKGQVLADSFYPDGMMDKVLITVAGKSPSVTIRDPLNRVVDFNRTIDLPNVLVGEIHNPVKGRYTLRTSADSPYSIKIGAETKNHFDHKFSTNGSVPSRHLINEDRSKIIIEAKNPSNLNKLTRILINAKNPDGSFYVLEYEMTKISEKIYETEEINFPSTSFEIFVQGIDSDGDKFDRFITGIVKDDLSESELLLKMKAQEVIEGGKMILNCNTTVKVFTKILWKLNGETFASTSTKELTVDNASKENAGKYECSIVMGPFLSFANVHEVNIVGEPKLELLNDLRDGEESTLKCSYQSYKGGRITWLDESGNVLQNGNQFYSFKVSKEFKAKTIACNIESVDFNVKKSIKL